MQCSWCSLNNWRSTFSCVLLWFEKLVQLQAWALALQLWLHHSIWPIHYRTVNISTHTHTHTRLTALCPGLPGWAGTRKVKPIWILLKQETMSGSGISWVICKSAPRSRQITMQHPTAPVFLQAGCPSCRPTNSVKALKAIALKALS